MKSLACALILLSLTTTVRAEDTVVPGRIIDAVIGDWNKDGKPDLALLVAAASDDQADNPIGIHIYLRDDEHSLLKLAASAPNKTWGSVEPGGSSARNPRFRLCRTVRSRSPRKTTPSAAIAGA